MTAMAVKYFIVAVLIFCANAQEDSHREINKDILQRIEQLEKRDRNQQMELKSLRQENEAMSQELGKVRKQNFEMKHEIAQLRKQGTILLDEIIQLKDISQQQTKRITSLEEKDDKLEKDIDVLVKQTEDATAMKAEQNTENKNPQRKDNNKTLNGIAHSTKIPNRIRQVDSEETPVAFFATLSNHTHHFGVHQPVPFDNAITNIGHAYHPSTGTFVAPVSGVYVFSATIFDLGENKHFEFAVNGNFMSRIFLHDTADNDFQTASQTAIFDLKQGDDVVLRNADNDKGLFGGHYCSFAGFLLASNSDAVSSQIVG